jgi:putative ABC transport system ATP-binding protein
MPACPDQHPDGYSGMREWLPKTVFQVCGVTKVYRMGAVEVHALRSVDLDLYEGEFVVLLGLSGSGKSTLLNLLGGLDVPSSGRVLFHDRDLTAADDAELTRFRRECVGVCVSVLQSHPESRSPQDGG